MDYIYYMNGFRLMLPTISGKIEIGSNYRNILNEILYDTNQMTESAVSLIEVTLYYILLHRASPTQFLFVL